MGGLIVSLRAGCSAACGVQDERWGRHSNDEMQRMGLPLNHVFSCIGAFELADGTRLLRLRSPWGEGATEWAGRWSRGASEWTPSRRAEMPAYTAGRDGTFFISLEDFCE